MVFKEGDKIIFIEECGDIKVGEVHTLEYYPKEDRLFAWKNKQLRIGCSCEYKWKKYNPDWDL